MPLQRSDSADARIATHTEVGIQVLDEAARSVAMLPMTRFCDTA